MTDFLNGDEPGVLASSTRSGSDSKSETSDLYVKVDAKFVVSDNEKHGGLDISNDCAGLWKDKRGLGYRESEPELEIWPEL